MSHFLDRLSYFTQDRETFSDGHGVTTTEDRSWERAYRDRWAHDKIVRSTHGVNCTGSCSWKIYVKGGIVTWETQQTDYPRTRPDMPNHEPRGCSRGASYSWYIYSANRIKYPMVRGRLIRLWREARQTLGPVEAWASIVEDPVKAKSYKSARGLGRIHPLDVGRGQRDHRRGERLHDQEARPRSRDRLFPDPRDVDGVLRRRQPLPVADRRRLHELLRLVLRPAAVVAADVGRADRRARIRRLVQLDVHHGVGQQRPADAHARRALLHRGPLQGREDRRGHARLRRGLEARGPVAPSDAGHRRRARDGDGARDPEGVPRRPAVGLLPGLLPALQRHADAREARQARQPVCRRPPRAGVRFRRQAGAVEQPGMEAGGLGRAHRQRRRAAGHDRLPLGPEGGRRPRQVESRDEGGHARRRDEAHAVAARRAGRHRGGRVSLLRRHRARELPAQRPGRRHPRSQRSRAQARARRRRGDRRHRVRPHVRELRRRSRPAGRHRREVLRRRRAVHAGVAAEDHRRARGPGDRDRAPVRRQRRQDARQVDGDHRRGDEPLVPLGHELPRHHQHADHVRLRRAVGRRLVALRRPGEAAAADGLDRARVRARLAPSAAPDELDVVLLRAHGPVALREARGEGDPVAARRSERVHGQPHRLQRARGADGLAAQRAAAADESAAGREGRRGGRRRPEGPRGQDAEIRGPQDVLRGSGQPRELSAQPVRVAVQPAGQLGQGPRVFPEAPARHQPRRPGQGSPRGRRGRREAGGGRVARRGAGREARPPDHARLPHVDDVPVLGHRAADGDLVREERPQHVRHAPVHPPAVGGGRSGLGIEERLGDLQGDREEVLRSLRRPPRRREGPGADADAARHAGRARAGHRRQGLEEGRVRARARQDGAADRRDRARLSEHVQEVHRARAADGEGRQRRQGHRLEHRARGEEPRAISTIRSRRKGSPRGCRGSNRTSTPAKWC